MIRRYFLLYFIVLSIPVFLGLLAWQSVQYKELERNVRRLEAVQDDLLADNNRIIANIAVLSSTSRIEQIAVNDLGLSRLRPENVLKIRIDGGHWQ